MRTINSALKRLGEGEFICNVHYPEEFAALEDPAGRQIADRWCEDIGYRLARLSEEGAYFMAYSIVTADMRAQVREDLRQVRNKLEPIVGWMETLRQSQGQTPNIHEGDMLWESEIGEAVRTSAVLERRLLDMKDLSGARITDTSLDRVRRMLQHLESEGYLVEANPALKGYRVTGKIAYLYQLLGFIAANSTTLADDKLVDQIDTQGRIDAPAPLDVAGGIAIQEPPAPAEEPPQ